MRQGPKIAQYVSWASGESVSMPLVGQRHWMLRMRGSSVR